MTSYEEWKEHWPDFPRDVCIKTDEENEAMGKIFDGYLWYIQQIHDNKSGNDVGTRLQRTEVLLRILEVLYGQLVIPSKNKYEDICQLCCKASIKANYLKKCLELEARNSGSPM